MTAETIKKHTILYDAEGNALALQDGIAIPVNTSGLLTLGSDGTTAHYLKTDTAGRPVVLGHLSHNNSAPAANNVGALTGLASATPPTYVDGRQVLISTTLNGEIRTTVSQAPSNADRGITVGKRLMPGAASNRKFPLYWTTYTEQTVGAQRSVKSSSVNDTAAGTGARTIKITYFNSTLTTKSTETLTLNGTTAVNTVATDICFIEKIEVLTVGSNGANAGVISLYTGTNGAGTVFASIDVAVSGTVVGQDNQTYYAHHYVLASKTCYIISFDCGTQGNQNAESFLSASDPTNINSPEKQISASTTVGLNAAQAVHPIELTIKVVGPAHIVMNVIPAGNGTKYFGSFDFWEE